MGFTALVYNRTDTVGFQYRPYEECNTSSGYKVCFDGEQMADLMDGKPDCWERAEPEEEEGDVVAGVGAL